MAHLLPTSRPALATLEFEPRAVCVTPAQRRLGSHDGGPRSERQPDPMIAASVGAVGRTLNE